MLDPFLPSIIPVLGLACNVVFQVIWLRLSGRVSLLRSIYAGFLFGVAAVCASEWMMRRGMGTRGDFAGDLLANLVIYALLGYGYFHFVNLGETARRVRLMRELYDAPEGLTASQILLRYNAKEIIATRIARLVRNGQIMLEDGRYRLGSPAFALISSAIALMKKAILGRSSEFE
jgi:hypothetical protein